MKWTNRSPECATVKDVVCHLSGLTEDELLTPPACKPESIQNLPEAAKTIASAIKASRPVAIMGDYDVDGITSASILTFLCRQMGCNPTVRLPKRLSEGYGLRPETVDEFEENGLLVTVDNGVAANDAIARAKERGMTVVVLDHHLPGAELPAADIIVDPHIAPEENGFVEYCGAGLSYKLAQYMLPEDTLFLKAMVVLAAIGTVADSVALVGDNRCIVKEGLAYMKAGKHLVPGLASLIEVAEVFDIDESDIAFKMAPMLNAAGRMIDDGADISYKTLIANSRETGKQFAQQLLELNEKRKAETETAVQKAEDLIANEGLAYSAPIFVLIDDIPEGIVGILAGRIAEQYKTPTFVLTSSEGGVIKGSGRSFGDVNLMDAIEPTRPFLLTGGGHAAAAAISFKEEDMASVFSCMQSVLEDYEVPEEQETEYDMEISAKAVADTFEEVAKYAPYGEGNPRPVFCVRDIELTPRGGDIFKLMGKKQQHIKMYARGYSAIYFGGADDYRDKKCPSNVDVVGSLSKNTFRYSSELQIEVSSMEPHINEAKKASSLLEALRRNGTI